MSLYFLASVLVLALLLYFPVSKLIWVLGVRRLQKREQRELSEAELRDQLNRARFIAVLVSLAFAYLFTLNVIGAVAHG